MNDIKTPLPGSELLWKAMSSEEWLSSHNEARRMDAQNLDYNKSQNSLGALFKRFTNNELSNTEAALSWLELRLLLHPLQALIYHLNKSFVHFVSSSSQRHLQRFLAQVEEVQYLLKQWYSITQRTFGHNSSYTSHGSCNMVIYHLVSLNSLTYLPDIERLARGEIPIGEFRESLWMGKRYAEDAASIWCHCGQIIRHFRKLPVSFRPYWWSASIYRVALCIWATGIASRQDSKNTRSTTGSEYLAVDALPFDHPSIIQFMRHQAGVPVVSHADGSPVILKTPVDIVKHCITILEEEKSGLYITDGIKKRLAALVARVSSEKN
jgi:hypothetical protein